MKRNQQGQPSNQIGSNRLRRAANEFAKFVKNVPIPNEKETRVVRLFGKDATYTDYLSTKKLKQGIMKELEKEPIDVNEALKLVEAEVANISKDYFHLRLSKAEHTSTILFKHNNR